jgi:hypothetical protein
MADLLHRVIDVILPSQEYLAAENRFIHTTGTSPTRDQQRAIKSNLRASKNETTNTDRERVLNA